MVEILRDGQDSGEKILRSDLLCWDVVKVIIPKTEEVTTSESNIIRLRGVGYGIIVIKKNALRCELRKEGLADKR